MKLLNVYDYESATQSLYNLLKLRSRAHAISHSTVPEYPEHEAFVNSRPYRYWYLVSVDDHIIGATYITENNEIGVFAIAEFIHLQCDILKTVIASHTPLPAIKSKRVAQFSINTNPENTSLISAIRSAGGVHVQNTYLLCKPKD